MVTPRKYPTTPMCDGEFLALFEPTVRDSDVLISTSAKCGQTWLQTLLFHFKTQGREPDLYGKSIWELSPWLELPGGTMGFNPEDRQERLARFEALPDPRVFKLHVIWPEIPRPAGSKAKIMTITRDPRDVPYSMFAHLRGMKTTPDSEPPTDFSAYFETWFERGFYFQFLQSFWPHRNDEDVLFLRYEDLHRDLRAQCTRILTFLDWEVEDAALARVLPLVDFQYMRTQEHARKKRGHSNWKDGEYFVREGAVGKNRGHLSEQQASRILARLERELGPDCCAFVLSEPS
jgi:hypothetical protein